MEEHKAHLPDIRALKADYFSVSGTIS